MTRKAGVQSQLNDVQAQYASLQGEKEKLAAASQRLQAKVDAFQMQKEIIKATYTASQARNDFGQALSDLWLFMAGTMRRAQDRTTYMQVREDASAELTASDTLDGITEFSSEDIEAEMDRMGFNTDNGAYLDPDIEAELQQLKRELSNRPQRATGISAAEADPPLGGE